MKHSIFLLLLLSAFTSPASAAEEIPLEVTRVEFHEPGHPDRQPKAVLAPSASLPSEELSRLKPSLCTWTAGGDNAILSWDAVAKFQAEGLNINSLSACTNGDPATGIRPAFEGEEIEMNAWDGVLKISRCDVVRPNAYNDCPISNTGCYEIPLSCSASPADENFPFCSHSCRLAPSTASNFTYKIETNPINYLNNQTFEGFFTSSFQSISWMQTLGRKMIFESRNAEAKEQNWSWSVPSDSAGVWAENFSPNLTIVKVRALLETPGQNNRGRYLRMAQSKPIGIQGVSFQPCTANPDDDTEINGDSCPKLLEATPGYLQQFKDVKALWKLKLLDPAAAPENQGLSDNASVILQFSVRSKLEQGGELLLYPSRKNLSAHYWLGETYRLDKLFKIDNSQSLDTWTLQQARVTGPNASEFSASLSGGKSQGSEVKPGGSFYLNAVFAPLSEGEKTAILELTARNQNGETANLRGELHIKASQRPSLEITPRTLSLKRKPEPRFDQKTVEIKNTGNSAIIRQNAILKGTDQTSFQIKNINGRPLSYLKRILPGQSEKILVIFSPSAPFKANYKATLNIRTSVKGDEAVELNGRG